jgi:hypothetical protein
MDGLMKPAVVSVPLRDWLLKKPAWFDRQTAVGLTFAVKTFAASLLALYIAFWAGLDDPRWSFLTVYIVSQPDSSRQELLSYPRHHHRAACCDRAGIWSGPIRRTLRGRISRMDLFLQLCRPCGTQFRVIWLPARRLHGRNRRHPGRPSAPG